MSGQRHATMVAAASLALTLTPLVGVFEGLGWTLPVLLIITAIAVSASLVRGAGRGQGLQTLAMIGALVIVMTAGFADGTAIAFIIPTPDTFSHWFFLVGDGVSDIITMSPPVEPTGGIMFLTMMGVGIVAILHDMFVVGLRTPALSGLTLLTMYLVPVSVAPDATAWFWFILPAAAYLWILADDNLRRVSSFGHRFTGSGQLVGQRFPSPLAASARLASTVFIALTLLLLTVIPTNTSGLIDSVARDFAGSGNDYGLGELNPWAQLSGSLNRPEEVEVLRVTTDDPNPFYLRMHVADEISNEGAVPSGYGDLAPLDSLESDGETFTAQVENLALESPVVPVYGNPVELDIDGDWGVDPETGVIASDGSEMDEIDSYSVTYTEPIPNAAELAAADGMAAEDPRWERNTAHPEVPELSERVEAIIADAEAETVHEKVLAIEDFLSAANGFTYSLETVDAGYDEPIMDFLETKQGFCQQYSTAMAWMLREADVPARVAIGLSRGTRSGDSWVLTNHDYHAWVEVYYEGPGWIPFDPTPSVGVPGSVSQPWATEPAPEDEAPGEEPTSTDAPSAGASEDPSAAESESTLPGEAPTDTTGQNLTGQESGITFNPAWLLLLLVAAVPFIPALWRGGIRRSRLQPQKLSAQSAWDEASDIALDYGVALAESLTPRQAAAVLAQAAPGAREAATALGSAMAVERYSPRGADPAGLGEAVADLRTELDKGADSRQRLKARFWPTSLAVKLTVRRGEASERVQRMKSRVRLPRRSNSRGDGTVTGRP